MKYSIPRWTKIVVLILTGGIIGLAIGADLGFRYAKYRQIEYSKELESYYVDSRLFELTLSMMTMKKAEDAQAKKIISDQGTIIRGLFLTLTDLYRTGHYKTKNSEIAKGLIKAREFMIARPASFIEQEFYTTESIVNHVNNPNLKEDRESDNVTKQNREQLQSGFDYVSGLASKNK